MTIQEAHKNHYLLSTDRSKLSLDTIHSFLSRSHWAANRKRDIIAKSIEHSLCYGIYDEKSPQTRQVAFARVVTDYCTYAYLCDVYVDEE